MDKSSTAELVKMVPVLPSSDIARDIAWYKSKAGFDCVHFDNMYAVLRRGDIGIHLQWHSGTADDPLLGGSVIKFFVRNIQFLFTEFVERGTIDRDAFTANTAWCTNEFGFFDLNKNAIFIVEDIV